MRKNRYTRRVRDQPHQEKLFTMNKNRHQSLKEVSQLHKENLRKNIERRLEAARAKGDENLIKMLEAEANYLN